MAKFIPKKDEKDVISIRTDIKRIEKLNKISAQIDISRNKLIEQCLDFALDNIKFNQKNKNTKN